MAEVGVELSNSAVADTGGGDEGVGSRDISAANTIENAWNKRPRVNIMRNERLKRSVLEINLEYDTSADRIDKEMISKLFGRLGIRKGEIEGFQVKRKKIFAWMIPGTDLGKFCTDECFRLGPGLKTSMIKPMDKSEVQVTIKGININTPDSFVFSYLSFFGKAQSWKVIYDVEKSGPLQGMKNGDRKFMVDFTASKGMGTYHLIDGESVTVSYSGQQRTCGRCHQDGRTCPGGGWARACEEKGTPRLEIRDHMKQLWAEIGFKPDNFELAVGSGEVLEEDVETEARSFTPPAKAKVSQESKEQFRGVHVRNLPNQVDKVDLMQVLEEHGLPKGMEENVRVYQHGKRTKAADIEPLSADICNLMIEKTDQKVIDIWDKKLRCIGISGLSPVKRPVPAMTTPSKNAPLWPPVLPLATAMAPPSESPSAAPPLPLILTTTAPPSLSLLGTQPPSLAHLAETLPGISVQPIAPKRQTKAERKKAEKVKKAGKAKPISVKTPGSSLLLSSGDEESSEDEPMDNKQEKKKVEARKLFRSNSSVSVKDVVDVLNDVTKKHKISPQQEERRVRNKGDSTIS